MFPGAQTAFRDDAVSDTGAPRAAGAAFDFVVGAVAARELAGYILTQSPERAVALADRFDARLVEVVAAPDVVASRAQLHMRSLGRTVTRAALSASMPRCRKAGAAYFNAQDRLVGRAHVARQRGRGYAVDPQPKRPFDRALFMRGLTPKGREAVAQLRELGNPEPTPAQVLEYLLRKPSRRMSDTIHVPIEIREAADSPGRIVGTILETGRVAADRREVFTPGSVQFPANGIRLLAEHRGRMVARVQPVVDGSEIRIDAPLPDTAIGREVAAEVRSGRKRGLSVEFYATGEQTVSGVREVTGALIDAAAVVPAGAYSQARVEVRERRRRVWL